MSWMFFLFGLGALTGQILLLRELLVIFHGTEISIGIFYGAWLVGIAVGASFGAWLVRARAGGFHDIFIHALAALGFSVIGQIILIRTTPGLFGAMPAELTPLRGVLAAVPAGTLFTSFLTGFLFPVGCRSVQEADDRFIARMYVFEAFGSLVGGLALTFLLLHVLSAPAIAALTALALASGAIVYGARLGRRAWLFSALPLLVLAIAVLSPFGRYLNEWSIRARWNALHPGLQLLLSESTPYQQVEIARLGNQVSLFGNGKIVSSFPDPHTANRMAALIVAQNPEAKRFLLIGGAVGSLPSAMLKYRVDRLDLVEPDPWAFEIAASRLPTQEAEALRDPRVHMVFSDGRFFVNRLGEAQYDVIVALVPDPVSAFWNRYYTLEFYRGVYRALRPDGLFITSVTSAENFWGADVASYAGSVYHTLKKVFPSVIGTPGDETLFFASASPDVLSLDPGVLAERYRTTGSDQFDPAGFFTILPPERSEFVRTELERSPAFINTDFNPVSASLAMILWGRFSGTDRMEMLNTIRQGGLLVYLIPLIFFLAARVAFRVRWGPRQSQDAKFQAALAMAAVGAAAMGLQIVLIYGYQSLFGYVFERIALMVAIFMVGLVVGGYSSGRYLRSPVNKPVSILLMLVLLALVCIATPLTLSLLSGREPWQIETVILGLVFVSGLLTGAVFPLVASRYLEITGNAGTSSGWTDAADHYGAATGALITGTLLVPLLGTYDACTVLALLLAVPAVLLALEFLFLRMDRLLGRFRTSGRTSFPFVQTSWALSFAVVAALTWSLAIGPPRTAPIVTFPQDVLEKISNSTQFEFRENPYPHYRGTSPSEPGSTVSLSTLPVAGEVKGYGGPINLLLSVSEDGAVRGVKIVESRETPSYLKGMDSWLTIFQGRSLFESADDGIDALSGATITCRAVTEILSKTGSRIRGPLLGLPEAASPTSASAPAWRAAFQDYRLWAVLGLLTVFVVAFYRRSRRIRFACLLASFVLIGLVLNAPFSCLDVASLLKGEIPAPGTWWRNALFVGAIVLSVLWGQAFCGFLCPFGALQELLSVKGLRRRVSPAVDQAARYVKFVLLAGLLVLFLVTDDTVWFSFSPLQHFFGWQMDSWVLMLSVTVLVASVFYFRFWCRYLCPAGAFLALFNKLSLLRRLAPRPIPAACDLGVRYPQDVDCIRCHRCLFQGHPASEADS
jgi:spermidine synthase